MQLSIVFIPNEIDEVNSAMKTLFGFAPRICISSLIMFFIANLVDVKLYNYLKKKCKNKKLWFRNNISTIICNCLENFGFVFLVFLFTYPFIDILEIAISTCIIEILIAVCDTPFLYIASKIKDRN